MQFVGLTRPQKHWWGPFWTAQRYGEVESFDYSESFLRPDHIYVMNDWCVRIRHALLAVHIKLMLFYRLKLGQTAREDRETWRQKCMKRSFSSPWFHSKPDWMKSSLRYSHSCRSTHIFILFCNLTLVLKCKIVLYCLLKLRISF